MKRSGISSFTSNTLSDVQVTGRTVLYEELAEYFYLFARHTALKNSSVNSEVDYHIGNLVLLTLYFDTVLIQTAAIFNSIDPFAKKIAEGVLLHNTFRQMLDHNVVKIVGWGGNNPNEMFQSAKDFSIGANSNANDEQYLSTVASVFNSQSVVSRSDSKPDDEIATLFRSRLEQTTIIRHESEHKLVETALEKSMENIGQLVAVSFNPELGKLRLSVESTRTVATSFIQSWHDHLQSEIPGVIVYAPLSNPVYIGQKMLIDENEVRTFLFSPQIFATFLSGYLKNNDFNKILQRPYGDLIKVKNGDWKRFSDAYHEAIVTVSENIGHLGHADIGDQGFNDRQKWSDSLAQAVSRDADEVDINAFVESLAMLSGVMLSMPYLGPLFKSAGVFTKTKVNETFHSLRDNATADVSPFIKKLVRHYELEGVRA